MNETKIEIPEPPIARLLFADTRLSALWLIARIYIGLLWLEAGWGKLHNPAWTGENAGVALTGFLTRAISKASGEHPDVQGWYAGFLEKIVLPNSSFFSHLVAWGELLVGIALILGIFTGIAAFFGSFMNANFLFAGTVSINPPMFILTLFILLAWRNAGYLGFDRFLLPYFGVPWVSEKNLISKP